jgi:SLOG cluster3 family
MMDVFLSVSIPLPTRDAEFFDTADVLLIREAVKALVDVVLPLGRITCGGHPAITPLLSLFAGEANAPRDRITIYQSAFFADRMPAENADFANIIIVPKVPGDRVASLTLMREAMIKSRSFDAAVIIGGMDGIFEEVRIFAKLQPGAQILPLASTGAAAAIVYSQGDYPREFATDLTYASLFRRRLIPHTGASS